MSSSVSLWTDSAGRASIRVLQGLIFAAGIALVGWILSTLALVTLPILIAIIFTSALQPVLRALRRRGLGRIGSTAITFVAALLALIGIFSLVLLSIYHQSGTLVTKGIEGLDRLRIWLAGFGIQADMEFLDTIEKSLSGGSSSDLGQTALHGLATTGEIITASLLTIVLLFFFLLDGPRMWDFLRRLAPRRHRARADAAGVNSVRVLGAYVRGTTTIALFAAVVDTIVMLIMGAPLAIPLGALIFFGAWVPILGALVTGLFATLVTLVTLGPVPALVLVIAVILVNQVEHHVLQPKVMGDSLGLHGAVVLVALAIGAHTGGISGAIVAVPLTAVAWAVIKTVLEMREHDDDLRDGTPPAGRARGAAPNEETAPGESAVVRPS